MFNTQYNRNIANEIMKINEHYINNVNDIEGSGMMREAEDLTEAYGGRKNIKTKKDLLDEQVARINFAKVKAPRRGRGMSAGGMSAGGMSAGGMSAGGMSAGGMSAGAKQKRGRPRKVNPKVEDFMNAINNVKSGAGMSAGAKYYKKGEVMNLEGGKKVPKAPKAVKAMPTEGGVKKLSPKERGAMVKKIMAKEGCNLGQASKMLSDHLKGVKKGGSWFDTALGIAGLFL